MLFIEHSSLRWLSIGPAVRSMLEQWKVIVQFGKFMESDPKKTPQSAAFVCKLQSRELEFLYN